MSRPRAALFLLSLAAVLFEIALTRIASVLLQATLTAVVIAVCLAALGLGAALAGPRLDDTRLPVAAVLVASAGGALAVAALVTTPLGFALGLFAAPFLGTGAFAAWVYGRGAAPPRTYAAEALGGALGAILAPGAIRLLGDVNAALAAAALAGLAGLLVAAGSARLAVLVAPAVCAANLFTHAIAVDPWSQFGFRPHMVAQTEGKDGRVLATAYDAFARTDLVETREPWLRYLFTDRMYTARVARWDGATAAFADAPLAELSRLKGFAFRALRPGRVLVLGSGGGFDVALALQSGATRVEAVEINGAMLRMTQELGAFAGHVYDRPEVSVHEAEARRFLRASRDRYGLVSLSLLQTDPAVDRANTGFQSWVFTREAVATYLDHLEQGGVLAIVQNTDAVAEKTVATALAALHDRGLSTADAFERLAVFHLREPGTNPFAHLVLVAREPWSAATRAALAASAARDGLRVGHLTGEGTSPRLGALVEGRESLAAWVAGSRSRLDVPTDDRPFFFDLNRALPGLFASVALGGVALLLALYARDRLAAHGPRLRGAGWLAAAGLGAGFLLLEAGLIARGQFLIGTPTLALALVIGSILIAAAVGAVLGPRAQPDPVRRLRLGASLVAGVALLEAVAWPWLAVHPPAGTPGLAVLTALLVAAVGLPIGFCLPALFEIQGPKGAAALYASNAVATVAASAAATLLAQAFGLHSVLLAGSLCYAACAVLAARRPYNAAMEVAPGLRTHAPADALEGSHLARILAFVAAHPRPFDRAIPEGHLTGSAIVVSASRDRVLLLHHKKLGLWLQPGGHGEAGESSAEAVALREALEETGIRELVLHPTAPRPIDVDVHTIPARRDEPAHEHLDLRYLVIAPDSAVAVHDPAESHAIRWFTWDELATMELDPGLQRALKKVKAL